MKKSLFILITLVWSANVFAQSDKIEIRTAEELAAIGTGKSSLEGSYILMNDLTVDNWTPIGGIDGSLENSFAGTFDGNGHTITINGFNLTLDNTRVGLFGLIKEKSVVKNLRVAGKINYTGGQNFLYIGGIVGFNSGLITCCVSSIELTCEYLKAPKNNKIQSQFGYETGRYGGCIAGVNMGSIIHCYSDGAITMTPSTQLFQGSAAGIACCNGRPMVGAPGSIKYYGGIAYCYSTASVTAPNACGIVAYNHPENSTFNNNVALNRLIEARGKVPKATPYTVTLAMAITHPNFQFHYREDMIVREINEKGEQKPAKISDKCAVAFSITQNESWWLLPDGFPEKDLKKILGFPFGDDEESPWKWSDNLKRPILYWETE